MRVGIVVASRTWLAVACVAICACGRLGFANETSDASDAVVDDAPGDAVTCTTEPFTSLPPGLMKYGVGTLSVQNGSLRLDFPGAADTELGVEIAPRSLLGASISIHVVSTSPDVFTAIGWHRGSGQPSVHLEHYGDQMVVSVNDGTNNAEPYDELWDTTQTWWRLRAVGTRLFAETSANGTTWQPLIDVDPGFVFDNAFYDIGVGVSGSSSGPQVILLDQLSTCGL